jgi:uncharacterized protein (DUF1778 family)
MAEKQGKKTTGRPKKAPADRREVQVKIRMTEAERVAFKEAARLDGKDLSEFARHWMRERARALGVPI